MFNKWALYLYNYFGYENILIFDNEGYFYNGDAINTLYQEDIAGLQDESETLKVCNYNSMSTIAYIDITMLTALEVQLLKAIIPFIEASVELDEDAQA